MLQILPEVMPTRKLLHELPTNTEQHAVSKLLLAILEERGPRATRRSFALFVDSILDLCGSSAQLRFVHIQLTGIGVEAPKDHKSLV
jgi:hypothetical protein